MVMLPEPLLAGAASVALRFRVSPDQEYLEATLQIGGRSFELPPRAHLATVYGLARVRMADTADPGIPVVARGWRYADDMARGLHVREAMLNLHVHRARRQLEALGVPESVVLVERRSLTRQLRLGIANVTFTTV